GQGTLLTFEPPAPHHAIPLGQLHGGVDFLHGLRHEPAHVALTHAPLDGQAPDVSFTPDLSQAVRFDELGELGERNPFAVGRTDGEGTETCDRIMVLSDTDDEVES